MNPGATLLFDARWEGAHGIGRFSRELGRRLPALSYAPPRDHLGVLEPWRLGLDLRRKKPTFYLSPGFNAIRGYRGAFGITIHDLIHLDTDERTLVKVLYYERLLRPTLAQARVVLTVSEFSRRRIAEWSGLPAERIHVVGNGVSAAFEAKGRAVRRARPYVLYVGNQKPHKNLQVLFRAFEEGGLGERFDLLLTGGPEGGAVPLGPWVHWLGTLSEEALAEHYRGAHALVMPSRYEGFGLPVVEAMACGTPVVASDAPALVEVAGGAATHFPVDDVHALVAAVLGLDDAEFSTRMRALGHARASTFSWASVAERARIALGDYLPTKVDH